MRERRRKKTMAIDNVSVKQAYNEFVQEKKAMNLSELTLSTYELHIKSFVDSNEFWDMSTSLLNKDLYPWWIQYAQSIISLMLSLKEHLSSIVMEFMSLK